MNSDTLAKQQNFRPYAQLNDVEIDAVHWTGGFWKTEFDRCQHTMIHNMWDLLRDPEISHAYTNFRIAAGLEEGVHRGPSFNDGDLYKWLEGVVHVYAATRDPQLDELMDEIIAVIGAAQLDDGYIHTPIVIKQRRGDTDAHPFQERTGFETYNLGHLMTTGCAHYRATDKDSLLAIAIKAGDYLVNYYQNESTKLARNTICPSHYMGVIELYRTTGDPKLLALGQNLIEIHGKVEGGGDDNQDRIPFREQDHAVGHAVRANYLYAGAADVYMETGDESLLNSLVPIWKNVVSQKMYITGGCGALYDGASPDGTPEQHTITRTHQAYGREYQLPNVTAYNETCANIGNILWNWRMLAITGEARFADVMELVLYNSALSSISLDGTKFFYTNPLRRVRELPFDLRWSRTRTKYISSFCCPPNIVRTIAQTAHYAYSTSDEGIWVHLYGGSTVETILPNGATVGLSQQTDYPWDGQISFTVDAAPADSVAIMLRIPAWCPSATITVNGVPVEDQPVPGTYAKLDRQWSSADRIELSLEMPVQIIESHPMVEETRNHLAVRRGPLVYCLESVDLPENVHIAEVGLSRSVTLTPESTASFDGSQEDIRVLRGPVCVIESETWDSDQLYRPALPSKSHEVQAQFTPYYAWDNRGEGEMSVWLPELNGEGQAT